MGQDLGFTRAHISACETKELVSVNLAKRVEDVYGVDMGWLLYGEGVMPFFIS